MRVARVTVKNALDESKVRIFDALIDTGATLLTLPKAWKQDLGRFLTTEKERVQLADQHEVDVEICGPLTIQLEGFRKINMDVAFVDMVPVDGRCVMIRLWKQLQILGMAAVLVCGLSMTNVNAGGDDLFKAAFDGNLDLVKTLLAANADVNAKAGNGATALYIASQQGHTEVVELLKKAGAK